MVAAAAVLGSLVVLVSTRHGIGANGTDSVAYLTMADDVAAGRMPYPTVIGVPPTHLPPGWSVLVGALMAILPGVDALSGARFVNLVFAGLLPVAVYAAVRYRARGRTWLPALLAVVVATSYPLFELASRAVVEAVFLVLLVGSLLAIDRLAHRRSSAGLLVAAALISALTLTRFVGIAALLPLGLTILTITPTWGRRLVRLVGVSLIVVVPTLAWYLLEPGSPQSSHLRGDTRAGLDELVLSVREAGVTLVRGAYLPSTVQVVIGLAMLATPIVAILLTSRAVAPGVPWRPRCLDLVLARSLGPWLWYLVGYTAIVVVQRWDIDREVISRYWLPYWILSGVILGRCLIEWALHSHPSWRRGAWLATVGLLLLASYNLVQVAISVRENARDGVTLNAVRYQESVAFDTLEDAQPGVIHTDHVQLVEFQMYARDALVPIERLSCRPETIGALVDELTAATARGERPAVAIVRRCRDDAFVDQLLAQLDEEVVVRDPDLGLVILPGG